MRHALRHTFVVGATALLVACSQPTTQLPPVSQSELIAEANKQKQLSHGAVKLDYNEINFTKKEKVAMQNHLQRVVDKLAPEATKMCREMHGPTANCDMLIELSTKGKGLNAAADGEKIIIYAAMVDFTRNEDEQLAFVLAHEYVHHMMGHVQSAKQNVLTGALAGMIVDIAAASQGINTDGQLTGLGAQSGLLQYSPNFEQEADYVALYILERAGFDVTRAPSFWRRMARYNPKGIYNRTTHPTTPERFVLMNKTIEEIKRKRRAGQRLLPNMQPKT